MREGSGDSGGRTTNRTRWIPLCLVTVLAGCGDDSEPWTPDGSSADPLNAWRQACAFFETPTGSIWGVQSFQ